MVLQNKNAVIYGAGGSLGGAVAKALAASGAYLFLTGRHTAAVQKLADEILSSGGHAEVDLVDALDEKAINSHLGKILQQKNKIDISFNAIGVPVVQNIPLIDIKVEDFISPVMAMTKSQFLTATTAGRIMMKQKSGVILSLTATPGGIGYPYTGGFAPACCAVESFSRNLAAMITGVTVDITCGTTAGLNYRAVSSD